MGKYYYCFSFQPDSDWCLERYQGNPKECDNYWCRKKHALTIPGAQRLAISELKQKLARDCKIIRETDWKKEFDEWDAFLGQEELEKDAES